MKYLFLVVSINIHSLIHWFITIAVLFGISGLFLILSLMINVVTLIVCYYKRKGKDNQSNAEF